MRLRTPRPFTPSSLEPTGLAPPPAAPAARPPMALALRFTLAPAVLALCVTPAPAHAREPGAACVSSDARDFPVRARIHGGPDAYQAGGDFGTWYIDLTNTTAHTCGAIHPVVVLVDAKRTLRPRQTRLEFYEGARAHEVTFERSDENENVGPFDDGFPGFTVAPGRTLTVKVRLSLTSDATAPNTVVVNAAVVQRHEDDGDWVGESNDYRFRVEDDDKDKAKSGSEEPGADTGADGDGTADAGSDPGTGTGAGTGASAGTGTASGNGTGTTGTGTTGGGTTGDATAGTGAAEPSDQLASTGPGAPNPLGPAVLALTLLVSGTGLLVLARRLRPRRC
ncbi:hypothetical protein [Streptomyces sp. NPDC002580]|uniref:hypothetical protein n=1 Tax=Streptomyces sp. NPDC002580 TaxID=3364653 RepID=UPI00369F7A47